VSKLTKAEFYQLWHSIAKQRTAELEDLLQVCKSLNSGNINCMRETLALNAYIAKQLGYLLR